ncbi:MAG: NAD(P)-dependent oxidoreductase [Prevotellaceae bacterium]|jgi:UDP-glucose 4-epimerase|nr:NAD(P)-dependent oxidoreductase [Prevotellaceae bacterium]
MESILITGASGFIGSFIVEEALNRKFSVWAGVRASSSREYLKNRKIHILELDMAHPNTLRAQLSGYKGTHARFDYIVHCAGVTKCLNKNNFERINYMQTRTFVEALRELNMIPKQFIFVSSLSVFGAIHEKKRIPITLTDIPHPNTAYGMSKLKAEIYLESLPGFPYVIYRPTGVYGPREHDYFLMCKSISRHIDAAVGFRRQDLTFIYVKDVVRAIFLGMEQQICRRTYLLSDGQVYSSRTFSDLIRRELGNPFVFRLRIPLFLLKVVSLLAEIRARIVGKPGTLNLDKYKIMKQRNWQCDISQAESELEYTPQYNLEAGIKETIAWYKEKEWL